MQITINIPEELADILAVKWGNLSQRRLEALAIEGYRRGVMTRGQVKQLLDLTSFYLAKSVEHLRKTNFRASSSLLDLLLTRYQNELDNRNSR